MVGRMPGNVYIILVYSGYASYGVCSGVIIVYKFHVYSGYTSYDVSEQPIEKYLYFLHSSPYLGERG